MNATTVAVPAEDIAEAIRQFIRTYDPLKQAREYFQFDVSADGVVTLSGNVRSVQAKRVLVDHMLDVQGVTQYDDSNLHDDEAIRLKIGPLVPNGVITRSNFGYVTLAIPAGVDGNALAEKVAALSGVRKVTIQQL